MSALLSSVLDAERLADCLRHEAPRTSDFQRLRSAIRRAELRTLDECTALLSEFVSKLDQYRREHPKEDLSMVLDYLAGAEDAMERVFVQDVPADDPRDEFEPEGNR